ncbi:6106_t:CDS:2, partial [Dentiscutata erythropus]
VLKDTFSSTKLRLPNKPLEETSLPYPLASDVSMEDYNIFIEKIETNGYKFRYYNGTVYIVEMCKNDHEAVIDGLRGYFAAHRHTYTLSNAPIQIRGSPSHGSPAGDGSLILPDIAVFPHRTYVPRPPVPHPGPPPSDTSATLWRQGVPRQK